MIWFFWAEKNQVKDSLYYCDNRSVRTTDHTSAVKFHTNPTEAV